MFKFVRRGLCPASFHRVKFAAEISSTFLVNQSCDREPCEHHFLLGRLLVCHGLHSLSSAHALHSKLQSVLGIQSLFSSSSFTDVAPHRFGPVLNGDGRVEDHLKILCALIIHCDESAGSWIVFSSACCSSLQVLQEMLGHVTALHMNSAVLLFPFVASFNIYV